ncbi:MAG: Two-component system, OmpR family, response regulator [Parcubacteria group bacterium]|nr:Two-component system, OmpR family, response regulator [Parcubacteria group bacterium]
MGTMRALLIDDERGVREILAENLRARAFAVDMAEDGMEGSYMARTNTYDIIVLDNMLPEKNGLTVCEEIRRTGNTTPILVLSVLSDAWRKVDLLNAGADDYMIKPFSFEELMARIRALLRRPPALEGDIIVIDTLSLDTKQQTAKRADASIYLTRKEYMLLEYLMRNRGSVLSRAMIMEHVWEMTTDPFSNTIESHILSLRKKIEGPGRKKLIHTVPGRGYRIDQEPF